MAAMMLLRYTATDAKGQLISKANCQAVNSSKQWTNEYIFTAMRRVFIHFLEEIEDSKKAFQIYLTFSNKKQEILRIAYVWRSCCYHLDNTSWITSIIS